MKKERRKQDFLHLPSFPGGKEAFAEFLKQNMRYPQGAIDNKIQGKVYVHYQVSDEGEVLNPFVTKGIGFGCDEEALRLVKLLKYDKVKNRGLRLISTIKTHIEFKLGEAKTGSISYSYTTAPSAKPENQSEAPKPEEVVYSYTITF